MNARLLWEQLRGWFAGRVEVGWLARFGVLGGSLWLFLELADEVRDGETHALDSRILLAMRSPDDPADPIGPGWVEELARDLTALGGFAILTLLCLAAAFYLAAVRRRHQLPLLAAAVSGGWLISQVLKAAFGRPRPDLVPHMSLVYSKSFPSGHAMMSAVTYLTLAALIGRLQPQRRVRLWLLGWATLLTVIVGTTRVYLGVHWPSDVVAGWCVGAAWAVLCWNVAKWQSRRRARIREQAKSAGAR